MSIYQDKLKLNQAGVAPLVTMIIIGAVTLIISLNLAYLGNGELEASVAAKDASSAADLARNCAEELLLRVGLDNAYVAQSASLSIGAGSCTISVSSIDTAKQIMVQTNGDYQRKIIIKANVATSSISINDWTDY